jgi:hypothetical protein
VGCGITVTAAQYTNTTTTTTQSGTGTICTMQHVAAMLCRFSDIQKTYLGSRCLQLMALLLTVGSCHYHAGHDHPGPLLGALGHWASCKLTKVKVQSAALHTSLQPSHLSHTRPVNSLVWTWSVLCTLTAHKTAHRHGHCQ